MVSCGSSSFPGFVLPKVALGSCFFRFVTVLVLGTETCCHKNLQRVSKSNQLSQCHSFYLSSWFPRSATDSSDPELWQVGVFIPRRSQRCYTRARSCQTSGKEEEQKVVKRFERWLTYFCKKSTLIWIRMHAFLIFFSTTKWVQSTIKALPLFNS